MIWCYPIKTLKKIIFVYSTILNQKMNWFDISYLCSFQAHTNVKKILLRIFYLHLKFPSYLGTQSHTHKVHRISNSNPHYHFIQSIKEKCSSITDWTKIWKNCTIFGFSFLNAKYSFWIIFKRNRVHCALLTNIALRLSKMLKFFIAL